MNLKDMPPLNPDPAYWRNRFRHSDPVMAAYYREKYQSLQRLTSRMTGLPPKVPWTINAIDELFLKSCGISSE
jgi:hypothetical protein